MKCPCEWLIVKQPGEVSQGWKRDNTEGHLLPVPDGINVWM